MDGQHHKMEQDPEEVLGDDSEEEELEEAVVSRSMGQRLSSLDPRVRGMLIGLGMVVVVAAIWIIMSGGQVEQPVVAEPAERAAVENEQWDPVLDQWISGSSGGGASSSGSSSRSAASSAAKAGVSSPTNPDIEGVPSAVTNESGVRVTPEIAAAGERLERYLKEWHECREVVSKGKDWRLSCDIDKQDVTIILSRYKGGEDAGHRLNIQTTAEDEAKTVVGLAFFGDGVDGDGDVCRYLVDVPDAPLCTAW